MRQHIITGAILSCVVVIVAGCQTKPATPSRSAAAEARALVFGPEPSRIQNFQEPQSRPLAVDAAVALAVRAMKERNRMPIRFKLTAKRADDVWIVEFWPVHGAIGAETTVFVYDDGKTWLMPGW